ncbi:hypothetical protein AVEN_91369-1 [Araneus ventricosus]|uniref:Tc1-like transposase DDE domain-containing protein n=1 Tax=Araneus ventricosus TaxID=182803 RepID=A0A4Y2LJ06_ARAVE|nr:hypothetical protein AVEN_91369-1 [Araneus ventricosus]
MTDISRYAHEGIEPQLRLNSDPPLLQPPEARCQHQLCMEGFTKVICTRGDQPFAYAYGAGSVFVWGGISLGGRTDLHVFPRGTVNAQAYRDDILDAYMHPYTGAIGDDFLLQDDNSRPHRTRIVDDYLQQETIHCMKWPARSPDLNPIENVWEALGRLIAALNPPPQTLATPATVLQEQWLSRN